MNGVDRQVAEILSMISAFKRTMNTGEVEGSMFYLNAAAEKIAKLKEELTPDD